MEGDAERYHRPDPKNTLLLLYMLALALVVDGGILTWACFERLKELTKLNHTKWVQAAGPAWGAGKRKGGGSNSSGMRRHTHTHTRMRPAQRVHALQSRPARRAVSWHVHACMTCAWALPR